MRGRIFSWFHFTTGAAVLAAIFAPRFSFTFDVATVITFIALLFAILVGFFFGATMSNHLQLQTLIANEDATLISLYRLAKLIDRKGATGVANAIDAYMVASLDYDFLAFTPRVRKELEAVVIAVEKVRPGDNVEASLYNTLHETKNTLWNTNQAIRIAAKEILELPHRVILWLFAVSIDVLLISLRDGSIASVIFISLLITTTHLVLKLLRDVDTNMLLATQLSYESTQEVFVGIGKLPYYPEFASRNRRVRFPDGPYRIGIYRTVGGVDKVIRTVRPSQKRSRSSR